MRVDNGFTIWNCLQAQVVSKKSIDELYEIGLRPRDPLLAIAGAGKDDAADAETASKDSG